MENESWRNLDQVVQMGHKSGQSNNFDFLAPLIGKLKKSEGKDNLRKYCNFSEIKEKS